MCRVQHALVCVCARNDSFEGAMVRERKPKKRESKEKRREKIEGGEEGGYCRVLPRIRPLAPALSASSVDP